MKKKLLIVDGHNFLFKAYFGVPKTAQTKNGVRVNAIYGFFSQLRKIVKKTKPDRLLIVFDSESGIKDKQKENKQYKSNRNIIDKNIFEQLHHIQKILKYIDIAYIENDVFEADDIIGSIAQKYLKSQYQIYIASNDFDFVQLIKPQLKLFRFKKGTIEIFDKQATQKKFGIIPKYYLDYLALKGDPSDNILGIQGIGTKTASNLIQKYKTVDNLLKNTNKLPQSLKEKIEKGKPIILNNKKFLKINTALKISIRISKLKFDLKKLNKSTNILLSDIDIT